MNQPRIVLITAFVIILATIGLVHRESLVVKASPITSWTTEHRADCAVVLTGGPGRVREGFDLLSQERVKKLIISGVYPHSELREIFPQWPYYGPLREEDIILEKRSNTTYGNAQQSRILVEALRCRDIVLITSNLHMHRAFLIFKSSFPEDFPIYQRSTIANRYKPHAFDLYLEAFKSVFYSFWAY